SPGALTPPRCRGSRRHSPPSLEVGDGTFCPGVRPHIELWRLEAVQGQDRPDLRAVVASVVRELSERDPELQIHLAPLVVFLLIEVDVLRLKELLDRVANAGQDRKSTRLNSSHDQ